MGRGGGSNHHTGNKVYQRIVARCKFMYKHNQDNTPLVSAILRKIKRDGIMRFLKKDGTTKLWNEIADSEAITKMKQLLRDVPQANERLDNSLPNQSDSEETWDNFLNRLLSEQQRWKQHWHSLEMVNPNKENRRSCELIHKFKSRIRCSGIAKRCRVDGEVWRSAWKEILRVCYWTNAYFPPCVFLRWEGCHRSGAFLWKLESEIWCRWFDGW